MCIHNVLCDKLSRELCPLETGHALKNIPVKKDHLLANGKINGVKVETHRRQVPATSLLESLHMGTSQRDLSPCVCQSQF